MSHSGVKALNLDDITEFYGKPYPLHFYSEAFKKSMSACLKKVKNTGKTVTHEDSMPDIHGNELWFHSTLIPVNNAKGKLDYIIIVSQNTTVRKQAELKLIESQEKTKGSP